MAHKHSTGTKARQRIRGRGWRKTSTIAADKYAAMSAAILKTLGRTPVAFGELVAELKDELKGFEGSIPWYAVACLRELEMQGRVTRHLKPVRYSTGRPPARRGRDRASR